MRRRIEFEMVDTRTSYWAIVDGDRASLNRLFVVLSNHLLVRRATQHDLPELPEPRELNDEERRRNAGFKGDVS